MSEPRFLSAAYRTIYLFVMRAAVWYELNSKPVANAYLWKGHELTLFKIRF